MTPRPDTFDEWEFAGWVKDNERELFIQVKDPETKQLVLKPLSELPGREWAFWAQRLFMDPRAQCKPMAEWTA